MLWRLQQNATHGTFTPEAHTHFNIRSNDSDWHLFDSFSYQRLWNPPIQSYLSFAASRNQNSAVFYVAMAQVPRGCSPAYREIFTFNISFNNGVSIHKANKKKSFLQIDYREVGLGGSRDAGLVCVCSADRIVAVRWSTATSALVLQCLVNLYMHQSAWQIGNVG